MMKTIPIPQGSGVTALSVDAPPPKVRIRQRTTIYSPASSRTARLALDPLSHNLSHVAPHGRTTMARNHLFTQLVWKAPAVQKLRHLVSLPRIYRYATARQRCLPDFIIAGAAKAGTTSLWWYLVEHPHAERPITKEVSFFDVNFHRGLSWYRMHFPLSGPPRAPHVPGDRILTGESTPYYMFHPLVPQRIAATLPDVKVILILRDPVDRAFSHYQLKIKRLHETFSFDDAIDAESERLAGEHDKILADPRYYSRQHDRFSYLARGLYLEQILRWQKFFPPEQLLILESGELFRRTADAYQRVLAFLGMTPWQPKEFGNRYPGGYKETMSPATRRKLIDFFTPYNEQLYAHLGVRFNWKSSRAPAIYNPTSAAA